MPPKQPAAPSALPNLLLLFVHSVIQGCAFTAEVFLRSGFGTRYIGLQAASMFLVIPFYASLWPGCDLRPIVLFYAAYLAMCLITRLATLIRWARGERDHSRYNGQPLLGQMLRNWSEETIKNYIEPALVISIGANLIPWNQPLGVWIALSGLCLLVVSWDLSARLKRQAHDMRDGMLEQQLVAEQFRNLNGTHF